MNLGKSVQRKTRQRQAILEELQRMKTHPTAADLYQAVRRRLSRISLGTVYRNLERLLASGEVRKLDLAGQESRFDGDLSQHHHVRCLRCGRLDDVQHDLPVGLKAGVSRLNGYEITGYRFEYMGICPSCQKRERS